MKESKDDTTLSRVPADLPPSFRARGSRERREPESIPAATLSPGSAPVEIPHLQIVCFRGEKHFDPDRSGVGDGCLPRPRWPDGADRSQRRQCRLRRWCRHQKGRPESSTSRGIAPRHRSPVSLSAIPGIRTIPLTRIAPSGQTRRGTRRRFGCFQRFHIRDHDRPICRPLL